MVKQGLNLSENFFCSLTNMKATAIALGALLLLASVNATILSQLRRPLYSSRRDPFDEACAPFHLPHHTLIFIEYFRRDKRCIAAYMPQRALAVSRIDGYLALRQVRA